LTATLATQVRGSRTEGRKLVGAKEDVASTGEAMPHLKTILARHAELRARFAWS